MFLLTTPLPLPSPIGIYKANQGTEEAITTIAEKEEKEVNIH